MFMLAEQESSFFSDEMHGIEVENPEQEMAG